MNRQKYLLIALATVLVLVLAYLFVVKPATDEMAQTREDIESVEAEQSTVRTQIAQLEQVRSESIRLESVVAAAEAVVPRGDPSLPAAVRQLQVAANDSGTELVSVALTRPTAASSDDDAELPEDLATIGVSVTLNGGYFQLVDFLRRIEDPVITPRGVLWNSSSIGLEEYPTLTANLSGQMFAYLDEVGTDEEEPEPEETETDVDVDVDVDVTETEEPA